MKIILKILALSLVIVSNAFGETKEEKRARYILINMHQDYITCYSFYKIGAEFIKKSNGDIDIIKGVEKSSDISLKLAYETGEMMEMKTEEMSLRVKSEMKKQLDLMDNDFNNASKLLKKYSQNCKDLIENKEQRISFWKKKASDKIR